MFDGILVISLNKFKAFCWNFSLSLASLNTCCTSLLVNGIFFIVPFSILYEENAFESNMISLPSSISLTIRAELGSSLAFFNISPTNSAPTTLS